MYQPRFLPLAHDTLRLILRPYSACLSPSLIIPLSQTSSSVFYTAISLPPLCSCTFYQFPSAYSSHYLFSPTIMSSSFYLRSVVANDLVPDMVHSELFTLGGLPIPSSASKLAALITMKMISSLQHSSLILLSFWLQVSDTA